MYRQVRRNPHIPIPTPTLTLVNFFDKIIETTVTNKVTVVEEWLCIDNKCLILQLQYRDSFSNSLRSFLNDNAVTFVGVDVGADVSNVRKDYGLICGKTADVKKMAMKSSTWSSTFEGRQPGLKDLSFLMLGLSLDKP
ncbi:hypothetical protein GIB67_014708 [Kingdonia uniflora]|uniref:Uncharacterized protein n=1 Tax=Kingdonia uniflora TaxID=39325 RepID=A0A7J7NUM6_9MAGN|nr:hypothetical protein GIB67_014708 [Kingdonia uniflora]